MSAALRQERNRNYVILNLLSWHLICRLVENGSILHILEELSGNLHTIKSFFFLFSVSTLHVYMLDVFIPPGCIRRIWPAVAPSSPRSEPLGHINKPFHYLRRPDPAFTFSLYPASICRSVSQLPISSGGLDSLWHPGKSVRHRSPRLSLARTADLIQLRFCFQ